jgi:hypothetical protein
MQSKRILAVIVVVVVWMAAGELMASTESTGGMITACYGPGDGKMYLIKQDGLRQACKKDDIEISWALQDGHSQDGHSLDAADGDPTDAVYVDADGKVGIGTTDPRTDLHIAGTYPRLRMQDVTSGGLARPLIEFGTTEGGSFRTSAQLGVPGSGDYLQLAAVGDRFIVFNTGLAERARITRDGNVGIGTVHPSTALDVNGTVTASAFVGDGSGLTNVAVGGYHFNSEYATINPNSFGRVFADCPPGRVALGGGASVSDGSYLRVSSPSIPSGIWPTRWVAEGVNTTTEPGAISVSVICAFAS